jgi:hypothetical protein
MDAEPPFLALLGRVTENCEFFDQAASEILGYARLLQDEETGLFFHGFEEACGRNGQIWARGNGWALMGLVEVLKLLPKDHSHYDELSESLVRAWCSPVPALVRIVAFCRRQSRHISGINARVMTAFSLREAFKAELIDESDSARLNNPAGLGKRLITEDGALSQSQMRHCRWAENVCDSSFGIFPWGQGPLLLMLTQYEIDKIGVCSSSQVTDEKAYWGSRPGSGIRIAYHRNIHGYPAPLRRRLSIEDRILSSSN